MKILMSYRAHSRAWSTSHPSPKLERAREQNKRKGISYQMKVIARMENSKATVMQKVFPRVNLDKII